MLTHSSYHLSETKKKRQSCFITLNLAVFNASLTRMKVLRMSTSLGARDGVGGGVTTLVVVVGSVTISEAGRNNSPFLNLVREVLPCLMELINFPLLPNMFSRLRDFLCSLDDVDIVVKFSSTSEFSESGLRI